MLLNPQQPLPLGEEEDEKNPKAQTGIPLQVSTAQSEPPPEPEPQFQYQPQVVVPVSKTQTQTTTKSTELPQAYGQAQLELDALQPQKEANLQKQASIAQAAADLEIEAIQAKQQAEEQNRIKQAELAKKREEEFAKVDADIQSKADAISKFEIKDFFADKSTFAKIMLGIATGVGQYSAVMAGGPNNAMIIIQNAIENDFQIQKATLDKLKMQYDITKGNRGLTQEKYDRAVSDLNLTHAQALSKASDLIKEKAVTSVKKPEIQQQLEANSIALKEQAAEMRKAEAEKAKREIIKTTQTDKSVQVVGGVKPEMVKEVQNFDNGSEPIKAYKKAKESYERFKERKNISPGTAVVEYMSKDMDQGSFSPEMLNLLKKRNLIDKAGNFIRENLVGGEDPELLQELERSLKVTMVRRAKEAKDDISVSNQLRAQAGVPPLSIEEPKKPTRGSSVYGR